MSIPTRPPLASQLFASRYGQFIDEYPACRPIVRRLRRAARDEQVSIEQEFQSLSAEAAGRKETLRQLAAARYYIRAVIEAVTESWMSETHGVTNYHELIDKLDQWAQRHSEAVVYVTFNYDTLLDTALTDVLGMRLGDIAHYVDSERVGIIKLHGSTNWRRLTGNLPAESSGTGSWVGNWVIDRYANIGLSQAYEVASPLICEQSRLMSVPAIAVPTETKTHADFELPVEHIYRLRAAIPQVTRVIIIGWRGREAHFWELWRAARPRGDNIPVMVVDRDSDEASRIARELTEAGMTSRAHAMPWRGFSDYLQNSDVLPSQ